VLERKRIEQLPINGRGYQAFLAAVPGITATGRIRAYGQPIGTHTLLFDGTAMNEVWEGWDIGRTPGLDAIEEFKVEVNASSAKFTRPTTIVLSSRSGTNEFHGALFYTNRNSGYGVARQRQDNYTKPPFLNRNEYGASGAVRYTFHASTTVGTAPSSSPPGKPRRTIAAPPPVSTCPQPRCATATSAVWSTARAAGSISTIP
jgi:hypothetical protein